MKIQGHWTLQQCCDFIKGGKVGDEDNLIPVPVCFRGCIYSLLTLLILGRIRLILLRKQFINLLKIISIKSLGSVIWDLLTLFFLLKNLKYLHLCPPWPATSSTILGIQEGRGRGVTGYHQPAANWPWYLLLTSKFKIFSTMQKTFKMRWEGSSGLPTANWPCLLFAFNPKYCFIS